MEQIKSDVSDIRLDIFLSDKFESCTRSYIKTLIENNRILVNGKVVKAGYKLKLNDVVEIDFPPVEKISTEPQNIPLDIVYEDADLLVVNKPQGMVVHPAPGNYTGTLVNALLYHCGDSLSAINGVVRPGIVHRIDKDTSGLLVVAKNNAAHIALSEQIKERKAVRRYYALLNGVIKEDGAVNKPIARHPQDRKKMAVVQGGREAITHYHPLEQLGNYTLTECILETGRTHQIRVHMASIGHSVVGDPVYGIKKEKFKLAGQLLHAKTIGFVHPRTGEYMEFSSELPAYFTDVVKKLRTKNK